MHDQSLCRLCEMLLRGSHNPEPSAWVDVLRGWHQATSTEEYRGLTSALESLGGFEPPADALELDDLQAEAMLIGADPMLTRARDALARGDSSTLRDTLIALYALQDTGNWSAGAQNELVVPAIRKLNRLCSETRRLFTDRIIRANDAAEQNKPVCDEEIRHFRMEVYPVFEELIAMLPPNHEELNTAREEIVRLLGEIANHCTWSDQFILAEELLREASHLGVGTISVVKIERSLEDIQVSVQHERRYLDVTPAGNVALKDLQQLCRTIREDGRSKVIRKQDASAGNLIVCKAILNTFRTEIKPALNHVLSLLPADHPLSSEARGDTALCLNGIAADFTWADEFVTAAELREEALVLATGTEVTDQVKEGIDRVREMARKERMYRELKPIASAPSLSTFNTLGFRLYGQSDHDPETNSFATTHYFVALFLPIFPVGRYRVIQDGDGYRFLGKLAFRKFDRWHMGVAISAVIGTLFAVSVSPTQTSNHTALADKSTSSAPMSFENPSGLAAALGDNSISPTKPHSSDNETLLASVKSQIDSGRSRMADLKLELDPVIDELTSLKSRIEPLDSELKGLDRQRKAGESIDIDDFNSRVETYNSLVARRRALFNAHSAELQTYEELEKQDSTLVDRYNALLKVSR